MRINRGGLTYDLEYMTMVELRAALKEEEGLKICPGCGGSLTVLEWNTRVDIIVCDNVQCKLYRVPVRNVPANPSGRTKKRLDYTYGP